MTIKRLLKNHLVFFSAKEPEVKQESLGIIFQIFLVAYLLSQIVVENL